MATSSSQGKGTRRCRAGQRGCTFLLDDRMRIRNKDRRPSFQHRARLADRRIDTFVRVRFACTKKRVSA